MSKGSQKQEGFVKMKKLFRKKTYPMKKAMEVAMTTAAPTDPYGMYTGVPKDPKEKPVQDADDL